MVIFNVKALSLLIPMVCDQIVWQYENHRCSYETSQTQKQWQAALSQFAHNSAQWCLSFVTHMQWATLSVIEQLQVPID